jgi:AcrR family transcriptional regulator
VPKLWSQTIESHRHAVHQAITDVTAALVRAHGLTAVTMSQIAKDAGIGRATLYKYFPDVESIMVSWHERLITDHLDRITQAAEAQQDPGRRLTAALDAYATLGHGHDHDDLSALLHRGEHVSRAQAQLTTYLTGLLADAAASGEIRTDTDPDVLAAYCLAALSAARTMPAGSAGTLVEIVLAGLRPQDR